MRKTTNTPKQLVPAYLDSKPASWRQDYVRNLRPVRGYPNWWRIVDNVAYIDGPPAEGAQYTRDLYVWKASIRQDAAGNNTDTLELYNLVELLDSAARTLPNGDTEYRYKYSDVPPALTYQHSDVIDSISLEFDQSGRRLVAFESAGDVFLIWFDPLPGTMVVTNWGAGYTPQIVTDTYRRTGGAADSERLLFYVDSTTKQIVYRRQADRYGVAYNLPSAPSEIVEILKVSKNLYGGLTVLYVYESSPGQLSTGSFTARNLAGGVEVGSDNNQVSSTAIKPVDGSITSFNLEHALVSTVTVNSAALKPATGTIKGFQLQAANRDFDLGASSATMTVNTGTVTPNFELRVAITHVPLNAESDLATLATSTGTISPNFELRVARTPIYLGERVSTATLSATSGAMTTFSLGDD